MRNSIVKLAALAMVAAISASSQAIAGPAPEISVAEDDFAAGGYDVITYFTEGQAVRGSSAHQLQYKGATWRFASAANRARFEAEPAAYAPQFGGYCAWAVSQGYIAPGDPTQWKLVDGKLYLNFNARAKELWEADQADAILRGHANWPAVLTNNQDSRK